MSAADVASTLGNARLGGSTQDLLGGDGGRLLVIVTPIKDSTVVCSIALQHGAPVETIRRALMRDGQGRPNGPLGVALDILADDDAAADGIAK